MAYTKLGIINLSLGRIGVKPTSAIYPTDTGRAAEQASVVWDFILDEVLEARDWKFARTRILLDQRYETPDYLYDYAYALPHDFLRFPRRVQKPQDKVVYANSYDESAYPYVIETVPLPEGLEKITNGTFTGAATGWTLGTGWTYGTNAVSKAAGAANTLSQLAASMVSVPVVGEVYLVQFELTAIAAGSLIPSIGGTSGSPASKVNTHKQYIEAASAATGIVFTPTAAAMTCTIDNVSVVKMLDRLCLLSDFDSEDYSDNDDKLHINYIKRVTDVTRYSPSFVNALAFRLAQELAISLTEGASKFEMMAKLYMKALSEADAISLGMDYVPHDTGDTSWEDAGRVSAYNQVRYLLEVQD
jgi:hypothetical protein